MAVRLKHLPPGLAPVPVPQKASRKPRKPRKAAGPLESAIQRDILQWLKLVGVWAFRSNTGAMKGEHKGKRWYVKFGVRGMADITAVAPGGVALWIEVKRQGEQLTDHQAAFLDRARQAGAIAFVARSVADVEAALAAEGYRVRNGRLTSPEEVR